MLTSWLCTGRIMCSAIELSSAQPQCWGNRDRPSLHAFMGIFREPPEIVLFHLLAHGPGVFKYGWSRYCDHQKVSRIIMNEGPYASWRGATDFIRLLGVQLCSFSFEYSPHLYLDPPLPTSSCGHTKVIGISAAPCFCKVSLSLLLRQILFCQSELKAHSASDCRQHGMGTVISGNQYRNGTLTLVRYKINIRLGRNFERETRKELRLKNVILTCGR